jgi:hypothetical protein
MKTFVAIAYLRTGDKKDLGVRGEELGKSEALAPPP